MRGALLFSALSVLPFGVLNGRYGAYAPDVFPAAGGPVSPPPPFQPISLPPAAMASLSSPTGMVISLSEHHHLHNKIVLAVALSCAAVVLIILSLCCLWFYWRKKRIIYGSKNDLAADSVKGGVALAPILGKFNPLKSSSKKGSAAALEYKLLETATNNFSDSNILGEGGFGRVYKARLDESTIVAVKRLDDCGADCQKEFENELNLLCPIQHPNIISLLGYSVYSRARFLVYELMQNGSLETQLRGDTHGSALTWHIRMKIALDTARGLEYLHEHLNPPIIHRDLKSSNILLDSNFNAKISDFGLAVSREDRKNGNFKLSGTLGYVAPEYLLHGELTEKSDVYAFGVVLLELLLGRKPVGEMAHSQCVSMVAWTMPQLTDRTRLPNIVDPVIKNTMDLKHLYQVAAVAVLCVQSEPSYRPLITDVLHSLTPLVPIELGGTLRVLELSSNANCCQYSHP